MSQFDFKIEPFEFDYEFEEAGVTHSPWRGSRATIKWVQQSLNQLLGLRLPVDGVLNPQTRSAIRSFQRRKRWQADSVAGSQMEAALLAALRAGDMEPLSRNRSYFTGGSELEVTGPGKQVKKVPSKQPAAPGIAPVTGQWLAPFASSKIPKYVDAAGKLQWTDCSIYVPKVAWKQTNLDLLVFFHGDPGPCSDTFNPAPKVTSKKFSLDAQIDSSGRNIALAVPTVHWIAGKSANVLGKWTAANFNPFVDEVLDQIGKQSGVTPKLGKLIIAGHSHAYAIFTPLACEFEQNAPAVTKGSLANLAEVWALDTTYSQAHVHALEVWARQRPSIQFSAVLYKKGTPAAQWANFFKAEGYCPSGFKRPANLTGCVVDDGKGTHCNLPSKYIRLLLSYSSGWCTF